MLLLSVHLIFHPGFYNFPCPVKPKPGAAVVLAAVGTASAHPGDPDRVAGQAGSIVGGEEEGFIRSEVEITHAQGHSALIPVAVDPAGLAGRQVL